MISQKHQWHGDDANFLPRAFGGHSTGCIFWQQQNMHHMLAELAPAPTYCKLTNEEKAMRRFIE